MTKEDTRIAPCVSAADIMEVKVEVEVWMKGGRGQDEIFPIDQGGFL